MQADIICTICRTPQGSGSHRRVSYRTCGTVTVCTVPYARHLSLQIHGCYSPMVATRNSIASHPRQPRSRLVRVGQISG